MNHNIRQLPWSTERLMTATGGTLACGPSTLTFNRVSIDSRIIDSGDLFVAIKGDNHDGHDFISMVLDKNVRGFVVQKENTDAINLIQSRGGLCLTVTDTTRALGDLAASQKKESGATLLAITGSNGKTSTRAMISRLFEQEFTTLSTKGNFNNHIGLPLTLLGLSKDHHRAVVEMGMNAPGEIARLAEIANPDLGIVTQVAAAHLEGLGSIEGVADAKAELLDALKPNGLAILNRDDAMFSRLKKHCRCDVMTFGIHEKADIRATDIHLYQGQIHFVLNADGSRIPVALNTPARFMVSNALAAAGAGIYSGLSLEVVKKGLESFKPEYGRMRIIESRKGFFVIDDTYNANPQSMMAAIDTLSDIKKDGKGIAVLADMFELGKDSEKLHRQVAMHAVDKAVDTLYLCGNHAPTMKEAAMAQGLEPHAIFIGSKKDIIEKLSTSLTKNDWVLIKGSRSMGMEEIVNNLLMLHGA